MKKLICLFLAGVLCLSLFVSCKNGTSIAIGALRLDNQVENLFKFTDAVAYNEIVTYTDKQGTPVFTAEYYYEVAEDIYAAYNVMEKIGDYCLYAYEGQVFTETDTGMTAVLLMSGTYTDFVEKYVDVSFILDGDTQFQRSSEQKDGLTYATYEATLTPQQTARVSEFGVKENDKILSTYGVRDSIIESVEYKVERDGEHFPLAKREIRVSDEKEDRFASVKALPAETIGVDIVFVNSETQGRHFDVPKGVYVGMETGAHEYSFYLDAACTNVYSFAENPINSAITLYAVEK